MRRTSKRDIRLKFHVRYRRASKSQKGHILDEFCALCGYHRKYAISLLRRPASCPPKLHRRRGKTYGKAVSDVLARIWAVAGYPWSVRLKALLPLWLPWAQKRKDIAAGVVSQVLQMSPRTMDRVLAPYKRDIVRRRFGRTKPGTLLKHQVPIRTDHAGVSQPGEVEVDLVAHGGDNGFGDFLHSVNLTDVHSMWTETRAVLGKAQVHVCRAIDEMRLALPFSLRSLHSDNGGEFINAHLVRYCRRHAIAFTRARPYKKNDNAHIEQKNWTHVRRLLGWQRLDSAAILQVVNSLYRNELRLWMNFFQPTVKLISKQRVGAKIVRRYDAAQTPLDRLLVTSSVAPQLKQELRNQRAALDPFLLAAQIEVKLAKIKRLALNQPGRKPHKHGYMKDINFGRTPAQQAAITA